MRIPIDPVLKGVVPAEMPAGFPHEALKAQAIPSLRLGSSLDAKNPPSI